MFQFEMDSAPSAEVESLGLFPELLFADEDLHQMNAAAITTKTDIKVEAFFNDNEVKQQFQDVEDHGVQSPFGEIGSPAFPTTKEESMFGGDLLPAYGKPSEITGQTTTLLDNHMAEDKHQVLQELQMCQEVSSTLGQYDPAGFQQQTGQLNPQPFHPTENVDILFDGVQTNTTTGSNEDPASSLMKELEDFMDTFIEADKAGANNAESGFVATEQSAFAEQLLNQTQREALQQMDTSCPIANSTLTEEDGQAAEEILDALLSGEINLDKTLFDDSGYQSQDISSTTVGPITTAPHQLLVAPAVVQQPVETLVLIAPQDYSSEVKVFNVAPAQPIVPSAKQWVQEQRKHQVKKPQQKQVAVEEVPAVLRKPSSASSGRVAKRPKTTPEERKEKKKKQNVEAARRYRDKKKSETQLIEEVEQDLIEKRQGLQAKHDEIANEVKTMKKLMIELGVLRVTKRS